MEEASQEQQEQQEQQESSALQTVEQIDVELERLDQIRIQTKMDGRRLNKLKAGLLVRQEIINRYLNGAPFSHAHVAWIEDNPKEWAAIKEEHKGQQGSRKVQIVSAVAVTGQPES